MKNFPSRFYGLFFIFIFLFNVVMTFAEEGNNAPEASDVVFDSETNFVDLDTVLTVEEAGFFFSTEKEFLDEAKRRTVPLPTESNWRVVPQQSDGPYAKLARTLQRVSKDVFAMFNKMVGGNAARNRCLYVLFDCT